jgi:hypothetical protein
VVYLEGGVGCKRLLVGLAVFTGQFAQFAQDLVLSLMPKGDFVGRFSQAPWISLHKHSGS